MGYLSKYIRAKVKEKTREYLFRKFKYPSVTEKVVSSSGIIPQFSNTALKLHFYSVKDCYIRGEKGQLISPLSSKHIIFEESFCYSQSALDRNFILYNTHKENKKNTREIEEAVALNPYWSYNFAHWVYENLPKAIWLEEQGYKGCYIVNNAKFITESLQLFGVAKERICYSDNNYRVKNTIIPSTYNLYEHLIDNSDLVAYLRSNVINSVGSLEGNNQIYIIRRGKGIVINEEEVIAILSKYDFSIILPESIESVGEQFKLMTNVNFTISPHGANTTPVVSQRIGSTFMELFSKRLVSHSNTALIKALSLNYIPLSEPIDFYQPEKLKKGQKWRNITVPINLFKIVVENTMKRIAKNT